VNTLIPNYVDIPSLISKTKHEGSWTHGRTDMDFTLYVKVCTSYPSPISGHEDTTINDLFRPHYCIHPAVF